MSALRKDLKELGDAVDSLITEVKQQIKPDLERVCVWANKLIGGKL